MDFDVLIVGDFHAPGGTAVLAASEITALHGAGYRVGLLPAQLSHLKSVYPIRGPIREEVNRGHATIVPADCSEVTTRLAILENPRCFLAPLRRRVRINADANVIVVHFPAFNAVGEANFDIETVASVCAGLGISNLQWCPVSPIVRDSMAAVADGITITDWDWPYIVDIEPWAADRSEPLDRRTPILGRHSRPSRDKWPASRAEMLRIYPKTAQARFLGFGRDALALMGERIPSAWQVFEFNEITPADFLRSIDHFVYFHHPTYIEAFGVAILEAMASGLVPILPAYLKRTFGDAALYPEPADAYSTVCELHQNWSAYRKRAVAGLDFVHERVSPAAYLKRVKDLTGGPRGPMVATADERPARARSARVWRSFDILLVADMTRGGDSDLRISAEIRALAALGHRVGLLHFPSKRATQPVSALIQQCVRSALAQVISPDESSRARLALIYGPHGLLVGLEGFKTLPQVSAERVVVIADALPQYDVEAKGRALSYVFGRSLTWAPTNGWIRAAIENRYPHVRLEATNWTPVVSSDVPSREKKRDAPIIGGLLPPQLLASKTAEDWTLVQQSDAIRLRTLNKLDFLAYYPEQGSPEVPEATIAHAMARGRIVLLPQKFDGIFGLGATYAPAAVLPSTIERFWSNGSLRLQASKRARQHAASFYAEAGYQARIFQLVGRPSREVRSPMPAPALNRSRRPRVLFHASNGTGLGHVARLLAVARRSHRHFDPVFAALGHAMEVVNSFGYSAEYIPSPIYTETKQTDWNRWYEHDALRLIKAYDLKLIVFDGSMPPHGLVDAASSVPDCKVAWIRRGMWRQTGFAAFDKAPKAHSFDLIVEPGELAGARDLGPTSVRRHEAVQVGPILLLDDAELLSREKAARALGINPDQPTVLIQLGSGSNRNIVGLIDAIMPELQKHKELQILIAEWAIGSQDLSVWNGTTRVKGFPLAQYLRAVDFAISAAGYNTFHETVWHALPTIFIANRDPTMDDQAGRAEFAQDAGAAFEIAEEEIQSIGLLIDVLLSKAARDHLAANCRRLKMKNGAADAVRALSGLV